MAASSRLRIGRYSELGHVYLLTTVIQGREPVFADWRLGRLVVAALRQAEEEGLAESLAWVVMPDHLHWLLALRAGSLTTLLRHTKSRSALAMNTRLGRSGRLWQKGFHDRAIRREEDLRAVARYVVSNPLRAGLVSRVGDYPLWDAMWV